MNSKMFGILSKYDSVRGFGFIFQRGEEGVVRQFFLHVTKIVSGEPLVGAGCYFDVGQPEPGKRPPALNVEIGPVIPKFTMPTPTVVPVKPTEDSGKDGGR